MGNENMPLAGIRVIELSSFISVATTARFFANMGADVIKVEPERGDPERYGAVGENISSDPLENTTWELENGNKRSIAINLKSEEGMAIMHRLLASADVFVTNNRPRALKKLGRRPFDILFVEGCRDNYDLLRQYPTVPYRGGQARKISGNLYQLLRGEVYEIEGQKVFAFGGGYSDE